MSPRELISQIKSELSALDFKEKKTHRNTIRNHKKFEVLHRRLFDLESQMLVLDESSIPASERVVDWDELMIKKKLIIKNRKKVSRSFLAWMFNNYDL